METIGNRLRKTAQGLVDKLGAEIANPNSGISKTLNIAENIAQGVADGAQKVAQKVGDAWENYLFRDGELDIERAKEVLKDKAKAAEQYGQKACEYLSILIAEGASSAKRNLEVYIPTKKEKDTIYAGIGTEYSGALFRQHYEACACFHETAGYAIGKNAKYREELLNDIKASASSNKDEIISFLLKKAAKDSVNRKVLLAKVKLAEKI